MIHLLPHLCNAEFIGLVTILANGRNEKEIKTAQLG